MMKKKKKDVERIGSRRGCWPILGGQSSNLGGRMKGDSSPFLANAVMCYIARVREG